MINDNHIPTLFSDFKKEMGLSYQAFADQYNEQIGFSDAISHQTVFFWVKGVYTPSPLRMQLLYQFAKDDRWRELALSVLKVLQPDEYAEARLIA